MEATDFSATKLGTDLTAAYGWGIPEFRRIAEYWPAAVRAADHGHDQRPASRGRRAFEVKASLLRDFGCPEATIEAFRQADSHRAISLGPEGCKKWHDLIFAANCIRSFTGLTSDSLASMT